MPKNRASAQIRVADGAGGMRPVVDLRFESGAWPFQFSIPAADSEAWMAHLSAEIEERGWNSGGISQLDATENSGTFSIRVSPGPDPPTLDMIWERPRGGALQIKARPGGTPTLSPDRAKQFIDAINERVRKRVTSHAHRWDLLTYDGLPWRGELWLEDDLRLGPPSKFPNALLGPQIVIVDAITEGIGHQGVLANFHTRVQELRIFLGVVLGIHATLVRPEFGWVPEFDDQQHPVACSLQSVGYWEVGPPRVFPTRGICPPVAREKVVRPGIGRTGIWPDMHERWVPDDIEKLWRAFRALPTTKREHFLRAANAFLITHSMWPDQRTAYAVFLVVACEALKPSGKRYDRMNVYDVVASLVGLNEARQLRKLTLHPQRVRSGHVHRGEL